MGIKLVSIYKSCHVCDKRHNAVILIILCYLVFPPAWVGKTVRQRRGSSGPNLAESSAFSLRVEDSVPALHRARLMCLAGADEEFVPTRFLPGWADSPLLYARRVSEASWASPGQVDSFLCLPGGGRSLMIYQADLAITSRKQTRHRKRDNS